MAVIEIPTICKIVAVDIAFSGTRAVVVIALICLIFLHSIKSGVPVTLVTQHIHELIRYDTHNNKNNQVVQSSKSRSFLLKSIILASASPRRKSLLSDLGVTFEVRVAGVAERDSGGPPAFVVESNAKAKCRAVAATTAEDALIIAADTLVFLDEQVLSKPTDIEDARRMLRLLSGNTHQVVTGLAVYDTATCRLAMGSESTDVTFRPLSDEEIECFVTTVRPLDRAGAYTVDGPGSLLVSRYDGCYQNVLGLPIVRLDKLMRHLDYPLFSFIDPEKSRFL